MCPKSLTIHVRQELRTILTSPHIGEKDYTPPPSPMLTKGIIKYLLSRSSCFDKLPKALGRGDIVKNTLNAVTSFKLDFKPHEEVVMFHAVLHRLADQSSFFRNCRISGSAHHLRRCFRNSCLDHR